MAESNEKKRHKVMAALKETMEGSNAPSFPSLVRTKYRSVKFMWIVCLLGSYGYCGYSIVDIINSFLDFEVISTTRENYENPISFPVISICNLNYFGSGYSNNDPNMLELYRKSLTSGDSSSKTASYMNYRFSAISASDYLDNTVKAKLGNDLNYTLVSCIFNNVDCLLSDFVPYFDPMYGSCFKFNLDWSKYLSVSGSMNGMQLELFTEAASSNENLFSMYNGFYIFVNNETSFNAFNNDGVSIAPGFSTNIILTKSSVHKEPKPYSDCTADLTRVDSYPSDLYALTFKLNGNFYKREDCLNMCFQKYVGDNCGCYDTMSGPFPSQKRPCLNATDTLCDNRNKLQFLENNLINQCDCPFECEKILYGYSTSVTEYPTMSYYYYLLTDPKLVARFPNSTQITYQDVKSRMASICIYYNQLMDTVITEERKQDIFGLISNIGGIMGLFLGMSLLSFIEFFEIFLQTFLIIYDERVNQKKKKENNQLFTHSLKF